MKSSDTSVQLARHLGVMEATMIGVGAMIGAGIFVLTGLAAGNAGPAALLAFGLNGVVTLFTALSYAELSSAIPEAGGGYAFIKKVMSNPTAFIAGWMLWFAYVVACSLYAKGFGSYFLEFFHRYVPSVTDFLVGSFGHEISVSLLTLGVGILFIVINIIGAHASGQTENVMTILKILILSVFIFFGVWQIAEAPDVARDNFQPFMPMGIQGVVSAMGLTFIAFEGYDLIATVSEEVKEPETTIPRAIMYSLSITVAVYLLVVFSCLGAVPPEGGTPTWQMLGNMGELGIIQAAQSFMPQFGVILVLGGGLFATLSALNATVLASSRVAFSMGRDWMLPNRLSRIHASRKTPVVAITVSGVLFLVVAVFMPLETIGVASSLLFLLTFLLVNVALILYRRRSANPPPFEVPFYPLSPVLGILTCGGLALYQLYHEAEAAILAAGWVGVGAIIYLSLFAKRAEVSDVPRIIESPELQDLKNVQHYKVLVPFSNPKRIQPMVDLSGKIARASQGEVIGMTVVNLPPVTSYSEAEPFIQQSQNTLNEAQQLAVQEEVPFSSLLKVARSVGEEIVQTARNNRCNLILMGYKKEGDPLENSVIHQVLTNQPCDVAILKSDDVATGEYERVLVPIRGKEVHDRLKARMVHSLQKATGCSVTFLTVVSPDATESERNGAQKQLDRASRLYELERVELEVREDDQPADAIVAESENHDLLILGMHEEPWFQSFFFGPMTEQIASRVTCPTLLTKSRSTRRSMVKRWLGLDDQPSSAQPDAEPVIDS